MSRVRNGLALLGWVAVSFVPAFAGRWFQPGAWYAALEQPSWAPPDWVFGPVWTALYFSMGLAAWLVWRRRGLDAPWGAHGIYAVQLVLNGMWSWIFFGLQRPGLAFAEILVLWLAIVATVVAFGRVRPLAGGLLLPYLAWVSFAAALNGTIWRLNA
jgi:translocator protein